MTYCVHCPDGRFHIRGRIRRRVSDAVAQDTATAGHRRMSAAGLKLWHDLGFFTFLNADGGRYGTRSVISHLHCGRRTRRRFIEGERLERNLRRLCLVDALTANRMMTWVR